MPPAIVAAGVVATGAVASAAIGSKSASKSAAAARDASAAEIAFARENRDYQYDLNAPTIGFGGAAEGTIAGLLGIGGDAAASQKAFDTYKGSTGYTTRLAEGLSATNNTAFAGGVGQSGAALKALQRYGQDYASNEFGNYVGQLGGVATLGANARGLVAGVGNNATNSFVNSSQNALQAGNQARAQGTGSVQSGIQGLVNSGLYALGSSYSTPQLPDQFRGIY